MNDDNNTTNPFEDAETNYDPLEENSGENTGFGNSNDFNNSNDDFMSSNYFVQSQYDNQYEEFSQNNEQNYDYDQPTFNQANYYEPEERPKNNSIVKKIPIIIFIIILLVILVLLLKSLLGGTEAPIDEETESIPVETINNDENTLNKRFTIEAKKLANGNIFLNIHNKNNVSVDADVTIEFLGNHTEQYNIKNIPAKSHYYSSVAVDKELREKEFEASAKLTLNKYKEYYNDKIQILKKEEDAENLLVEIKNDSYSEMDAINVYALYFDASDQIIGFEESSVKKVPVDGTSSIKIGYPRGEDYNFVSFSRYEVGINTAYSFKEK